MVSKVFELPNLEAQLREETRAAPLLGCAAQGGSTGLIAFAAGATQKAKIAVNTNHFDLPKISANWHCIPGACLLRCNPRILPRRVGVTRGSIACRTAYALAPVALSTRSKSAQHNNTCAANSDRDDGLGLREDLKRGKDLGLANPRPRL